MAKPTSDRLTVALVGQAGSRYRPSQPVAIVEEAAGAAYALDLTP